MIRAEGQDATFSSHMHKIVIGDIFSRLSITCLIMADAAFIRRPVHGGNGAKKRAKRSSTMPVAQFIADRRANKSPDDNITHIAVKA